MNPSYYKYCIVPQCKNTSLKTPDKLFIYVPNNPQMRRTWLKLARRDGIHCLSTKTRMYFCEDHFDLPNDMLNYTEYHIMGKVSQVRMKPDCIPSKFECQEDKTKRTCSSTEPYTLKKQRTTTVKTSEQALSPVKPSIISCFTSPFKAEFIKKSSASVSNQRRITRNLLTEEKHSDSDISLYNYSSVATSVSSVSLRVKSSSDCSELIAEDRKLEANEILLNTIKKIQKLPSLHIGIPRSCSYLIDLLKDEINIHKHYTYCFD